MTPNPHQMSRGRRLRGDPPVLREGGKPAGGGCELQHVASNRQAGARPYPRAAAPLSGTLTRPDLSLPEHPVSADESGRAVANPSKTPVKTGAGLVATQLSTSATLAMALAILQTSSEGEGEDSHKHWQLHFKIQQLHTTNTVRHETTSSGVSSSQSRLSNCGQPCSRLRAALETPVQPSMCSDSRPVHAARMASGDGSRRDVH